MQLFAIPILKNRLAYYCHSTLPTTSRLVKLVEWNPTKEHLEHPLEKAILYHPSQITTTDIELSLKQLLDERVPYHRKYMIYSIYWVPIACAFGIVPFIPNIPLAYNLFRLYSHYKAYKGAQHLEELIKDQFIQYNTTEIIDDLIPYHSLTTSEQVVFPTELIESYKETSKLDTHVLDQSIPGVLDQNTLYELSNRFNLPTLNTELQRARNQILTSIFLNQNKH
ncbi:unnamed protein product [Cunninghamella echinulata]